MTIHTELPKITVGLKKMVMLRRYLDDNSKERQRVGEMGAISEQIRVLWGAQQGGVWGQLRLWADEIPGSSSVEVFIFEHLIVMRKGKVVGPVLVVNLRCMRPQL